MDQFKKYLQQHREELDSDVPGDAVWQKIRETATPTLPQKSLVRKIGVYAAAACLLLCLSVGIFLLQNKPGTDMTNPTASHPSTTPAPATAKAQPLLTDTLPAPRKKTDTKNSYAKSHSPKKGRAHKRSRPGTDPSLLIIKEVEQNYAQLLNRELKRLQATPVYAESPDYFSAFQQQYKQIGSDEALIRNDIQKQGLNDELLQQLINVNQQKLNVLKDLLAEIEKLNRKVQLPQNVPAGNRSFYLTI